MRGLQNRFITGMACFGLLLLGGCDMALLDPKGLVGMEQKNLIITALALMLIGDCKKICVTGILTNLLKGQQNAIIRRTHRPTAGGLLQP